MVDQGQARCARPVGHAAVSVSLEHVPKGASGDTRSAAKRSNARALATRAPRIIKTIEPLQQPTESFKITTHSVLKKIQRTQPFPYSTTSYLCVQQAHGRLTWLRRVPRCSLVPRQSNGDETKLLSYSTIAGGCCCCFSMSGQPAVNLTQRIKRSRKNKYR